MKHLFLTFAMLSALLAFAVGCSTTHHEMTPAPAASTPAASNAAPAASSGQKEIVTPAVALPPAETPSPAGSK